jgi:hypothetical protein
VCVTCRTNWETQCVYNIVSEKPWWERQLGGVSECRKNVLKPHFEDWTVRVWADSFVLA